MIYPQSHIEAESQETKPCPRYNHCLELFALTMSAGCFHVICSHLSCPSNHPFVRLKSLINVISEMNPDQRVMISLPRPLQDAPTEGGRCQCYNRWWVQLPVWAGATDETTNCIFSSPYRVLFSPFIYEDRHHILSLSPLQY